MSDPGRVPLTVVTAAVIRDGDGRVLLARRPEGKHMAGLWEFPGGKVDDGEEPAAGLERELAEELGVEAEAGAPITFAVHSEPGLRVLLLFYSTRIVRGEPRPHDGQQLEWVATGELHRYPTPPADAALVRLLQGAGPRTEGGPP
jgi:8-oxo-dGTP diphosphatase